MHVALETHRAHRVIGRAKSDRASPLMTKIMHGNLLTDARLELWAGKESGRVICACGEELEWSSRAEIGRLQWHMLGCMLPHETKVRREWHSAVRRTLESFTDNARVMSGSPRGELLGVSVGGLVVSGMTQGCIIHA